MLSLPDINTSSRREHDIMQLETICKLAHDLEIHNVIELKSKFREMWDDIGIMCFICSSSFRQVNNY